MDTETLARICHEANRAFCAHIGDHSQKPWADAEEWQRKSAIQGVEWRLANLSAPDSHQHDSWMAAKVADGWVYGPVKDDKSDPKTHPCLVPFDQLPPEQRFKDVLFVAIINAAKASV